MTLSSGTRVSLRYTRERTRGTTPAGVATAVDSVAAVADGGASGLSKFTRATGSFVTDGFTIGQYITSSGFTTSANNGNWRVEAVTATELTVEDTSDAIQDEAGAGGQEVQIALQVLRATSRNVNPERNLLESQEVRPTGQVSDVRHGFERVVGSFGYELSRGAYDDILELAFGGTWGTVATTGTPNLAVSSSTIVRASGSWITDGYRQGDIIRTSGFSNSANNADWRVTAVTETVLTIYDPLSTMVDETSGGGKTVAYPGKRLDVDINLISLLLERAFSDVSQYQKYNGVVPDQLELSVEPEAIIGGQVTLLGMSPDAMSSSSVSPIAVVAAPTNSPFAAFDGQIFEGETAIAVATALTLTTQKNRSLNPVIGSKNSPDVFDGTLRATGNLTAYFEDATLFNKFINETESSLWLRLDDPNSASHFLSLVFPRIKYTGGDMDPPQQGPVPLEMPYMALEQSGLAVPGGTTTASTITIQRSNATIY